MDYLHAHVVHVHVILGLFMDLLVLAYYPTSTFTSASLLVLVWLGNGLDTDIIIHTCIHKHTYVHIHTPMCINIQYMYAHTYLGISLA